MHPSSDRALAARIGGYARWAKTTDPAAAMRPAWQGQAARFIREVDPDGVLPPAERDRRATAAMKAHMSRLALRSAKARRKAREAREEGAAVAAELAAEGLDPDTLDDEVAS